MSQNTSSNEIKLVDLENKFEKIVYIVENGEQKKTRIKFEEQNKIRNSKVENINNINNCGSLFIKDFKIRYVKKEEIIRPQVCSFKPLQDNLNPFLVEKFDLSERRFIDLKNVNNADENIYNIFSLDTV